MPQEQKYYNKYFQGPVSALVIGISDHKHGRKVEKDAVELADNEFPNLKYAADDAKRFADFLYKKGVNVDDVTLLMNEEATLPKIKNGILKLQQYYENTEAYNEKEEVDKPDPLIIVFFSGHGWADDKDHYLVPYEAQRDDLNGTAFSNWEFSTRLEKIKTTKLVVFLDACHAGAMAGANNQGASKGNIERYDYKKGLNLGDGDGKYIISSCKPDQKSWEYEKTKSGIFTHHLLQLLYCEEKEIVDKLDKEEIDILTLYTILEEKVNDTSVVEFKVKQEPQINIENGSKFIIAINEPRRQYRINKENQDLQDRFEFLDKICKEIDNLGSQCEYPVRLQNDLKRHIKDQKNDKKDLIKFYRIFDEHFKTWIGTKKDVVWIKECCESVNEEYKEYNQALIRNATDCKAPSAPPKPAESAADATTTPIIPNEAVKQIKESETADTTVSNEKNVIPLTVSLTAVSAVAEEAKIGMNFRNIQAILQPLIEKNYTSEENTLFNYLKKPEVSENDFNACIQQIKNENNSAELHKILDEEVVCRFKKLWLQPRPAMGLSSIALRNF